MRAEAKSIISGHHLLLKGQSELKYHNNGENSYSTISRMVHELP